MEAIKVRATVLPGHRVEVVDQSLAEGAEVELIVLQQSGNGSQSSSRRFANAWDYIQSLKPRQRTTEEWAEIEREIREEKEAWDR